MQTSVNDYRRLADPSSASDAARFLKAMANNRRLMVLCALGEGERSVSELQARIGLSQSALSQHLAVLRHEGLVSTRRESQTIYYQLADERIRTLMPVVCNLFGR